METDLPEALADFRATPFPGALRPDERYGLVTMGAAEAEVVDGADTLVAGDALAPERGDALRQRADELAASLIALPTTARVWATRLLLVAELALQDAAGHAAPHDADLDEPGQPDRDASSSRPRTGLIGLFRGGRQSAAPISDQVRAPDPTAFVDEVEAMLFAADPVGIAFGTNTDEYRPEAESIVRRLPAAVSVDDVQLIVHEEFVAWFDPATAGPVSRYRQIAARIWLVWSGQV